MFLNASIPNFLCWMRKEFLYNLESHHGEFIEVCVFGVASIRGRAIGFHVMTDEGAQVARVPIHALVHEQHEPHLALDFLEIWDCFSYDVAVTEFEWLKEIRCAVFMKDRTWHPGQYQFTLDWCGNRFSEDAGDNGHKNAHVIALDCGCYAAQPNNRLRWYESSFIVKPFPERPDYKTNTHVWSCEDNEKWVTEPSDGFFYHYQRIEKVMLGHEWVLDTGPNPPTCIKCGCSQAEPPSVMECKG